MDWNDQLAKKICDRPKAQKIVAAHRLQSKRIGFTNGCFDLLHYGHYRYLAEAKNHCDFLVIGLNSDPSVKRLKGEERPIHHEQSRAYALASLAVVDLVVVFEEDTPLKLIETLQPDVLMKGGDYTVKTIVGAQSVLDKGGQVEVIPFEPGYSSSAIIERIRKV